MCLLLFFTTLRSSSWVLQALVALKKGTQLLKYGRKGKPKFTPFRLSNVSYLQFLLCFFFENSFCSGLIMVSRMLSFYPSNMHMLFYMPALAFYCSPHYTIMPQSTVAQMALLDFFFLWMRIGRGRGRPAPSATLHTYIKSFSAVHRMNQLLFGFPVTRRKLWS